ncbi:MAG: sugar ABC transporter ATP-binding protein [Clostridia bacterium]|nr:sugar ABC transporter ATP-binding protein [Clostridia bacterium]
MTSEPILTVQDMHMVFPGVHALKGVDFDLYPAEVHALVGENGAGKSTLIKILSGVYQRSSGAYSLNGEKAAFRSPAEAISAGISVIYQELSIVPCLSVAENIYFGRLPAVHGRVRWKELYEKSEEIMARIGLTVSPKTKAQQLSLAQQQLVEIAKAVSLGAKIIIMDEPTSALSPREVQRLFGVIRTLKAQNVAIIYVSHKLDEVFEIADRISVFKDGALMGTMPSGDIDQQRLIEMMVGRKLSDVFPKGKRAVGELVLDVSHLSTEKVHDISFQVRRGEIVGFAGLMGSGRTEMTKALYGIDKRAGGTVCVEGAELTPNAPVAAREAGMGLVVENRREGGVFPTMSVKANITVVSLRQLAKGLHIRKKEEAAQAGRMIDRFRIRTPSMEQLISKLSGGNQQKVLLARWLTKQNLKVLVIDEPTRGIDVGAKAEIYTLMDQLARSGLAIVMVSSELPEIIGMSDRVYVMKSGQISGECSREQATEAFILEKAIQ